jgi:hydrogenase maturation protein HypF
MHRLQARNNKALACKLRIGGRVQGVGYRPFVYHIANKYQLVGYVKNSGSGVSILVQGEKTNIEQFIHELVARAPSNAEPVLLEQQACDGIATNDFKIVDSEKTLQQDVHLPTDLFVCDDCLKELYQPSDRRYRYPFINCTQCGPRYTLIRQLPYDRINTTMDGFVLCPACKTEYENPSDRRFHAEPIACPQCGPQLVYKHQDTVIKGNGHALQAAISAIQTGEIVVIKGIGGYHIVCDAMNPEAINNLRTQKPRPDKPLAIMFPQSGTDGLDVVRQHVELTTLQAQSLVSSIRPIVLVEQSESSTLPHIIAPGMHQFGVMLPYSPLHHLLLNELASPIIATSANISGEPLLTDNRAVEKKLQHISQHYLHHDRPIERPADDPVYQVICNKIRPIRLGRGTAPLELNLPFTLDKPVIACGGHMKNTVALAWQNRIVISPYIGELDTPRSLKNFEKTIEDLQALYGIEAHSLICDRHPGYASHRWAKRQNKRCIEVQHHIAHASCLTGEYPDEENWLVFTWDGIGLGDDNTLWGGEALFGHSGRWQRKASWRPFQLPGGEKTARQPWRSALSLCWEAGLQWQEGPKGIELTQVDLLKQAWLKKHNCPATSSVGRLFDAAAALSGICTQASFEGQAAMWLQQAAKDANSKLELPVQEENGLLMTDWQPLLTTLLDAQLSPVEKASIFHLSLAHALVEQANQIRKTTGDFAVGLSGGVFQNQRLTELVFGLLNEKGFRVYMPEKVPVNDAGLSYGQVIEVGYRQQWDTYDA